MKSLKYMALSLVCLAAAACQNKDIEIADPILQPIDEAAITGAASGDYDYVWSWTADAGMKMQVAVYVGTDQRGETKLVDGSSFTHERLETNVEYTYVFKLTDGTNFSKGVLKRHTRQGATPVSDLAIVQKKLDDGGFEAVVEWKSSPDATKIEIAVSKTEVEEPKDEDFEDVETVTVDNDPKVEKGEYSLGTVEIGQTWKVKTVTYNDKGKALPDETSLLIGRTGIGFLSIYETEEKLKADGDDDEKYAWYWMKKTYPEAQYVYFGDITDAASVDDFRVLFWIRDLLYVDQKLVEGDIDSDDALRDQNNKLNDSKMKEEIFTMPAVVSSATPFLTEWYKGGGSLLLWQHAVTYIGELGRLDTSLLKDNDGSWNARGGGMNPDEWAMGVAIKGGDVSVDNSTHRIFRGINVFTDNGKQLVSMIGSGWKEDHNSLVFNIPAQLTGKGNQSAECYKELTETYGIYPLGTWDSQTEFVSQLNVWEARRGNTDYKGTVLCIGNGGCEFWQNNSDGSENTNYDKPVNKYQENIEKLAKNSIDYLRTR